MFFIPTGTLQPARDASIYSPYFNIKQTDFTHVNAICNVLKFEKVKSDVVL